MALDESAEQGVESAVGRAVREHAGPMLRARVARALTDADEQETIALGRLLVWLASEDSISDFRRLLRGREEVSVLALAGLRKLSALRRSARARLPGAGRQRAARLLCSPP